MYVSMCPALVFLALARGPCAACAATSGSCPCTGLAGLGQGLSALLQPAFPSRKLPLIISWLIFEQWNTCKAEVGISLFFFFFLLNISANQSDWFAGKEWQSCSLGYKLFCQGWGGRKLLLSCCSFHPNLSSRVHLSLGLCCLLRSLYASTMQWLKRGTGALQRSCAVPRAPCCQLLLPYFTSCQCFWSCNTWS